MDDMMTVGYCVVGVQHAKGKVKNGKRHEYRQSTKREEGNVHERKS